MNLGKIIQTLSKDNKQIYSKIVRIIEHNNTGTTIYTDDKGVNIVDVEPIDGTAKIYGVRLSADNTNSIIPAVNSYAIVIFINNNDAFLTLISNVEYTRQEVVNEDGEDAYVEIKVVNDKSIIEVESTDFNMKTNKGGTFSITDKDVLISNVEKLRFQITDESGNLQDEIFLDKDNGISIISYNNKPISIKNNTLSLKTLLNDLIDKFVNATYISSVGTATVSPTSKTEILAYKTKIATLLN